MQAGGRAAAGNLAAGVPSSSVPVQQGQNTRFVTVCCCSRAARVAAAAATGVQVVSADYVVMATGMHVVPNVPVYKVRLAAQLLRTRLSAAIASLLLKAVVNAFSVRF